MAQNSATLAAGETKVLDDISWFPHQKFQVFHQIMVDPASDHTGDLGLEVSPDGGTTWVPVKGMEAMTSSDGPYPFQVIADQYRVKLTGGTGSATFFWA